MKKTLPLLTFLLFAITATHTAWGQTFTITASDHDHISLHFELNDFRIDTVVHEGERMHTIATKAIVMPNDYGLPTLPTFNRFIAIPQGAKAIVEVSTTRDELLSDINIMPSVGSQAENDPERPFFRDPKVYTATAARRRCDSSGPQSLSVQSRETRAGRPPHDGHRHPI